MEQFNQLSSERLAQLLSHVSQLRRSDVITLLSSATILACVGPALFKLSKAFWHQYRSPLRLVPGPKSSNFFIGNLVEIGDWINLADSTRTIRQWTETFGPIFKCKLFFNVCQRLHSCSVSVTHPSFPINCPAKYARVDGY